MAQRVRIEILDDLTGDLIDGDPTTITFTFDGRSYDIDLNDANAAAFRDVMTPYVAAARPHAVSARSARRERRTRTAAPVDGSTPATADASTNPKRDRSRTKAIRAWAVDAGMVTPDARGRLAADVIAAYDAAHPAASAPAFTDAPTDATSAA